MCTLCVCITAIWLKNRENRTYRAFESTISSRFMNLEKAVQAQGHVITPAELDKKISDAMGKAVAQAGSRWGARFESLVQGVARVEGKIGAIKPVVTTTKDGIESATLTEDRVPPRSKVDVSMSGGRVSQQWTLFPEEFRVNVGQWRSSDGGMKAALSLDRTVNTPSGPVTESLKLNNADAYFTPEAVSKIPAVSKFDFAMGPVVSSSGKKSIGVLVGRPINRQWSLVTGRVGDNYFLMGRYSW